MAGRVTMYEELLQELSSNLGEADRRLIQETLERVSHGSRLQKIAYPNAIRACRMVGTSLRLRAVLRKEGRLMERTRKPFTPNTKQPAVLAPPSLWIVLPRISTAATPLGEPDSWGKRRK